MCSHLFNGAAFYLVVTRITTCASHGDVTLSNIVRYVRRHDNTEAHAVGPNRSVNRVGSPMIPAFQNSTDQIFNKGSKVSTVPESTNVREGANAKYVLAVWCALLTG